MLQREGNPFSILLSARAAKKGTKSVKKVAKTEGHSFRLSNHQVSIRLAAYGVQTYIAALQATFTKVTYG